MEVYCKYGGYFKDVKDDVNIDEEKNIIVGVWYLNKVLVLLLEKTKKDVFEAVPDIGNNHPLFKGKDIVGILDVGELKNNLKIRVDPVSGIDQDINNFIALLKDVLETDINDIKNLKVEVLKKNKVNSKN